LIVWTKLLKTKRALILIGFGLLAVIMSIARTILKAKIVQKKNLGLAERLVHTVEALLAVIALLCCSETNL
jgi:hypothetical protein